MVIQAKPTDAQQIADLINSDSKHLLRRTQSEVEEQIHNFVVMKERDKVIACGAFEEYAPKIAEIRSVIVDKYYRKKVMGI